MYSAEELLMELAQRGVIIEEIQAKNGGNSRLYKFRLNDKVILLKVYLGEINRINVSRNREREAYKFLYKNNFSCLAKLVPDLEVSDGICIEYIEGCKPRQNKRTNLEILDSFLRLKSIFESNPTFGDAIDATFSTNEVLRQIELRTDMLDDSLTAERNLLLKALDLLKLRTPIHFPKESITYSFSDVGAHNIIKQKRAYYFIDLEFFGRDSAVKMVLDYVLHPRNQMSRQRKVEILRFVERHFEISSDNIFNSVPFFAAKWATIVARRMSLNYGKPSLDVLKETFVSYIEIVNLFLHEDSSAKLKFPR